MDNEIRIAVGSERRRSIASRTFTALAGLAVIGLLAYGATRAPRFFGFDDELRAQFIEVQFQPDASVDFRKLLKHDVARQHEGRRAHVKSAIVQRKTGDYVFTIGFEETTEQMFVVATVPRTAEGREALARATMPGNRVSVSGEFRKSPELSKAKSLFQLGDFVAEGATPPSSHYILADTVKPVEKRGVTRDTE